MKTRAILNNMNFVVLFVVFLMLPQTILAEEPKVERPTIVQERTDIYIHKWLRMPELTGRTVSPTQEAFAHKPVYGRGTVVVFLASYCQPCQEQMDNIRRLETRYKKLFTDFIYVFVNDSNQDALDFSKEYAIEGSRKVHGSFELLKAYKNPPLPSVYIGDRHGWIGTRYLDLDGKKIDEINHFLRLMTAI